MYNSRDPHAAWTSTTKFARGCCLVGVSATKISLRPTNHRKERWFGFLLRTLSTKLNNKMRWELTIVLVLLIVSVSTSFRSSVGFGGSGLAQAWRTSSSSLHVLNFMAATVADLAPSTDVIFDKNTKYSINEASFNDLASIVSLRVNVFYPELKSVVRYVT